MLLSGAPGLGKSLLARAIAGESGLAFIETSGSAFDEIYIGQGAKRVREVFAAARRRAPCVVFIDEIDAVGVSRSADSSNQRQTLEQLLVEIDGSDSEDEMKPILVVAATNRPTDLDDALVRAGRFDVHVQLYPPDARAREAILRVHCRGKSLEPQVDLAALADLAHGFSGAALASLVNAAAIRAAMEGRSSISEANLSEALDRVELGIELKCKREPREKLVVATHEAGHAVVAAHLLGSDSVRKVTIVAHGAFGGATVLRPSTGLADRDELERRLAVTMAGRAAEARAFGPRGVTAGAASDLAVATASARDMVARYGLGATLAVAGKSPAEEARVDREAAALVARAYARAARVLRNRNQRRKLAAVAAALVDRETLSGSELALAMR